MHLASIDTKATEVTDLPPHPHNTTVSNYAECKGNHLHKSLASVAGCCWRAEGMTTNSSLLQHTCVCYMQTRMHRKGNRENEVNASADKAIHLSRKHAHRFLAFATHMCVCNLYGNVLVQPHTHTPTMTDTTVTMHSWLYAAFNVGKNTWNTSQIPQPDA